MNATSHTRRWLWLAVLLTLLDTPHPARAEERLEPIDRVWLEENYTKHEFSIPMRDGIKLFTAVYAPKDQTNRYPIWLNRTPYSVRPYGVDNYPEPRGALKFYGRDRFIFAFQDVRGRYGSEGEFMHVRPLASGSGPNESTDTYDTIEWLLKRLPNHNDKVGLSGISYPGFYAASGAVDSHPALKAVSPQAPIGDWFVGDDFHHNGTLYLAHAYNFLFQFEPKLEKPTRETPKAFDYETPNGYEFYLNLGPLANADVRFFKGKVGYWNEMLRHETYDAFWQERTTRGRLKNIRAGVLVVGGWFDAEDLFGTLQTYHDIATNNPGIFNTLVMGPWAHGQWHTDDGEKLGAVSFRSKTAEFFRQKVELPFFRHFLKGDTNFHLPRALAFETGTSQWREYDQWPPAACTDRRLFLQPQGKLTFDAPVEGTSGFDEYISDPAKPVPFIPNIAATMTREHMLDDQRFASARTDVLTYQTEVLTEDLTIAGPIVANLHVSTSGTDSDWVLKLIDVYPGNHPNPDPNPQGVQMGGYQQLVRGEPMRGKFRESFVTPKPFEPGRVTAVSWTLPDAYHTFRRGHRIMVQIQSSWFPLVDRNPQTFCTIPAAKPEDFQKATQRVYHTPQTASSLRLSVLAPR